jgi:DegV family protein with EDD domain
MTIRIVTDSTADLPPELARELDIAVVPVYVNVNGHCYRDGVDIDSEEIYRIMETSGSKVTTSQPSPEDFAQAYRRLMKEADSIVSINLTSRLSGVHDSALQGREMADARGRVEVLDSGMLSMGMGLVAVAAARLARAGVSLPNILEQTKQAIARVHVWGILDTMKYILNSGRLGRAKALVGSMINVKPILTLKNGELFPSGFARTRSRGIDRLIENFKKYINAEEIGIVHSTTPDEARTLRSRLSAILDSHQIHISRLGPALGVHGGPGTLIMAIREPAPVENHSARGKTLLDLELPSFHIPRLN